MQDVMPSFGVKRALSTTSRKSTKARETADLFMALIMPLKTELLAVLKATSGKLYA
jgi:hypothetical protein